jgi:hypothetical protein
LLVLWCKFNIGIKIGDGYGAPEVMTKPKEPPKTYAQERKYRRFNLKYPVHVKVYSGNVVSELDTVTRNVSLGGMLLETAAVIPQHSPLSFVMTLRGGRIVRPIELAGQGKVVRVETLAAGAGFAVAVECNNPITQIEPYLPAAAS